MATHFLTIDRYAPHLELLKLLADKINEGEKNINMNLTKDIEELEKEIILKENLHRHEMKEIRAKIKELRNLNTACEKCNGEGELMRRLHGESEEETKVTCRRCGGTGKKA